jgi:hypothetical protein
VKAAVRLATCAAFLLTRAASLVGQQQGAATPLLDLKYGVTVSADTVTVGQPFEIRVRIRAPLGSTIRFPENPDTAGPIQSRDPRTIATTDSVQFLDQIATYRVAAWDVGRQVAIMRDAVVTFRSAEQRVRLAGIGVNVRVLLPQDSAQRVPKPARPLWDQSVFPWWIVALVALGIALLLWWWLRRRKRPAVPIVPAIDPYDKAAADFARIEAMGLVDAGERTRFVSLVIEVLRDYLAARYPDAHLALTSRELVALLRRTPAVSGEALMRVLHDADLAKFAGLALEEDRARAVGRDARALVDREHRASQQLQAQAAA